jgi:hypothetical protein
VNCTRKPLSLKKPLKPTYKRLHLLLLLSNPVRTVFAALLGFSFLIFCLSFLVAAVSDERPSYRAGLLAFNSGNLPLARLCLEQAHQLASDNWFVLDTLIQVLYVIGDKKCCLEMCEIALQVPLFLLSGFFRCKNLSLLFP